MRAVKSVGFIIAVFVITVIFAITVFAVVNVFSTDDDFYADERPDDGMVYNSMDVSVDWSNDRSCYIKQHIEAEFLDDGYMYMGSHGIYVDIPVNSGEKIRGLSVSAVGYYGAGGGTTLPYTISHEYGNAIVRVRVGDEEDVFYAGGRLACDLEYEYITPKHPDGGNILDINAIGYGWMSATERATVTVTYPTEIDRTKLRVMTGDRNAQSDMQNFSYGADGKSVTVKIANLQPFCGVRVRYAAADGAIVDRTSAEHIPTTVIAAVLVAATALLMLFAGRDKPLTPIVDFYPPRIDGTDGRKRHMLPVQMGKIIDGACSDEDVTSLIFYWASEGYLQIDDSGSSTALIKVKDIDPVTHYERVMFDKLFERGVRREDGTVTVTLSSLKGKFADSVGAVKTAVNDEYSGRLYSKGGNVLAGLMIALTAIFAVVTGMLITFRVSMGYVNILGVATLIPVAAAAILGSLIVRYYVKLPVMKRRLLLCGLFTAVALLSVATMFLVPSDVMSTVERIIYGAAIGITSGLAPFLSRRTDFYTDRLNEIVGFRDFLRDAEKDRLETLVKDDPQYFYNILPYANVLGVSQALSDKFKDITVEPPAYYRGRDITVFDVFVFSRLCRSMGSSLTYRPPSSRGISGSRGSFGGGGRGGGGGFGGGGGGRW